MSYILERTRSIVVVDNDHGLLAMALAVQKLSKPEQRALFGGSPKAGWFYLFADDKLRPGEVFESVVSPLGLGSSVSALYKGHPVFESIGELVRTRELLVDAIAQKVGLAYDSFYIDDKARGELTLPELSTGQLVDLLMEQERGSIVLPNTANYGLEHVDQQASEVKHSIFEGGEVGKSKLDEAAILIDDGLGNVTAKPLSELK